MLHLEPLTGGLVTARDASLLDVGELTLTNDGIYRPFNQALSPIRARVTFGSAIGVNISGLRAIPFEGDSSTRVIVAHGTSWQVGTGGAWSTVFTPTAGLRIEAIHYNNQYFLSNGTDTPQVINSASALITHGMNITDPAGNELNDLGPANTGGDWTVVGVDQYEYWFTEYDSVNGIESASGAPDVDNLSSPGSTTGVVRLQIEYGGAQYLIKHNTNATHWRLYRGITGVGDPAPTNYATSFPFGVLIREIAIPGGAPAAVITTDEGIVSTIPYAALTISVAGAGAVDISRDTVPPFWNTGDLFEDQLAVNDAADKSILRYSFPGLPHSFPNLYFIGFETKQADEITHIRSIGEALVVGLKAQIWRVNYLPNETDSEFNRGRCKELISANHGIMGYDAATPFTMVDGSTLLAYVSHDGLYATDGFKTRLLTMDIDWEALVNPAALSSAILINVQHLWTLFLYYTRAGSTYPPHDGVLALSYHPQHIKEGGFLKVSGPLTLSTRAADYATVGFVALAGLTNVLKEDITTETGTFSARTRLIYPEEGSLDTETAVERVRILTGPFSAAGTFNVALRRRKSNTADATDTSKVYVPPTSGNQLLNIELHGRAEAFGATINSQADVHYIGFEHSTAKGR